MPALRANFIIEQGATFNRVVRLKIKDTDDPVILTGYTALMQIRKTRMDDIVLVQLSTDSLPEDDGTIVIEGPFGPGTIELTIEHTETAGFDFEYGVHDLLLISPAGVRSRPIEGSVTFSIGSSEE